MKLLAFDIKLMRPACVLVAAGMGAHSHLASRFDPQDWLLAPTPDLKVYPVTDEQIEILMSRVQATRVVPK